MVGLGCVIIVVLIWSGRGAGVAVESNYNYSLVHEQALLSDPTVLPVRLLPHHSHRSHLPLLLETFHLKKFELRDTDYHLPQHNASPADEELIYSMEPPAGVFAFETMTIENYRLLEMRRFSISLSNPSRKFTLCVSEILPDSEELRRSDERGSLPACLGPLSSRQFNFTLYAAFLNPQYIRATVYFFIDLYDEQRLVEEKVYPRRVFATVTPNHLRLETAHLRNCPLPHTLALKNYEIFPIDLYIEHKKRLYSSEGAPLDQPSRVHPTKSLKIEVEGRSAQMIIHTSASEGHPHHFPPLLLKTYCEEPLSLDYYNIGIIPDERMVIEVPVSISSLSPHNATILAIHVDASSETVTVEAEPAFAGTVPPQQKNLIIGVMRVHSRAKPERSSSILVKVSYRLLEEEYTASQRYRYCEIRHPVAVGQKRFVDVSKINRSGEAARMGEHRFPIRNNLNVPLYLLRVIFDESLFQLSWLQDRRNFIYPNHNREQFLFSYTGSLSLPLSSMKYVVLLEFNGHLFVPLEIVVYDHTLQCISENVIYKCANITSLDYGYFKDSNSKSKQLVIRNWNPESKNVQLTLPADAIAMYGINATMKLYSPLPTYEPPLRTTPHAVEFLLRGQQFVIVSLEIELLQNATSAALPLQILSSTENIITMLRVRVENGTIALIPQIIRLRNAFGRTVDYLNLVSTFSEKYRISNISTNHSCLTVHANNHSHIQQNQWVGMILVYDPYAPPHNITALPWTNAHLQHAYFHHQLAPPPAPALHIQVRLATSTGLEVNSSVIVENHAPLLIAEAETVGKEMSSIRRILVKRKRTADRLYKKEEKEGRDGKEGREGKERQIYDVKLRITNPYPETLKYRVLLISEPKMRELSKLQDLLGRYKQNRQEDGFFCLQQAIKTKHSVTAVSMKSLLKLASLPEEYWLQFRQNELHVLNSQRERVIMGNNNTLLYLLKSFSNNCKVCYRFVHHAYLHRLIHTELPNKILQDHSFPVFLDFLKLELLHYQDISLFELDYAELHHTIRENFPALCQQYNELRAFRFCHYINAKVSGVYAVVEGQGGGQGGGQSGGRVQGLADQTWLLGASGSHDVVISTTNPADWFTYHVVVANNYSRFESYSLSLRLLEPKLQVSHLYLDSDFKIDRQEFENHYFADFKTLHWDKWHPAAAHLPVYLTHSDYLPEERLLAGRRVFEVYNDGEADVEVLQIGIGDRELSCAHLGVEVGGLNCDEGQWEWRREGVNRSSRQLQPFVLRPFESYNLTLHFRYAVAATEKASAPVLRDFQTVSIYLYCEKGYYFRLTAIFKVADESLKQRMRGSRQPHRPSLLGIFALNAASLLLITLLLCSLRESKSELKKQQSLETDGSEMLSDPLRRFYNQRRLSRIMRESAYSQTDSSIGVSLQRKQVRRPVHLITEDMLLSVKEVKQRELKKYFNESEESEIGLLGINHHLSLSHSISYEQEEHDNNQQIIELDDISQQENAESGEPSSHSSGSLPEGEVVDVLNQSINQDSWYDFNQEINHLGNKSSSNASVSGADIDEMEFYNVFRCEVGLRRDNNTPAYLFPPVRPRPKVD